MGRDYYNRSYIVYFLHREITPRELKYIDKELDRNKNIFRGTMIFIEDKWLIKHPKFINLGYRENYTILYQKEIWDIFKNIKDKDYMKNRIVDIFGEDSDRVNGYIYEMYCKKENDLYTYVFPMPFVDFSIMDWINYMVDSSIHGDINCKVVCNEFCIEEVRNFLKDKVEVICLMEQ